VDIFLIIGIFTGLFSVIVGMIVKGADISVLLNPAAAIIIIVGSIAAVVNSFTKKEILNVGKVFGVLFREQSDQDPVETIKQLVEMSQNTRKNGLLSLESTVQAMDNRFMKKGLEMVVDGVEPDYIREVLETEIDSMEARHRAAALIFTTAGSSAPTLGVLGAVVGLIGALGNLADTEKLAHMIAAAFVATLYGIFFGYVLFNPFGSRLKRKSAVEVGNMNIILEGILGIQSGANPKNIETKLTSMLEPKDRLRIENNGSEV
jgi:chemotaxis protein MotA